MGSQFPVEYGLITHLLADSPPPPTTIPQLNFTNTLQMLYDMLEVSFQIMLLFFNWVFYDKPALHAC